MVTLDPGPHYRIEYGGRIGISGGNGANIKKINRRGRGERREELNVRTKKKTGSF